MKYFKQYGAFVFWVFLLLDLALLDFELDFYRKYTNLALMPILIGLFWIGTRKSRHYNKKVIIYLAFLCFWSSDFILLDYEIENINKYLQLYGLFKIIGYLLISYIFYGMESFDIKKYEAAFLGLIVTCSACYIAYKILKFGYSDKISIIAWLNMAALIILNVVSFNLFKNKQKSKLAINGFIPGAFLSLISFLVLLGYLYLLHGEDTKMMLMVSVLCNGFGLILIIQNLVKYLKG